MSRTPRKPPKTRAESKQATRLALLEAGIEEVSTHGLDASLDAICARAKLTRGAFYVHFADREAFLIALMQHLLGNFIQSLASTAANDVASAVRMFFSAAGTPALYPAGRSGTGLRFHHVLDACRRSDVIGDTYRRIVLAGRDRLASVLAADRTRAGATAHALADLLVVMALGTAVMLELELPIDRDRLTDTVLGVVGA